MNEVKNCLITLLRDCLLLVLLVSLSSSEILKNYGTGDIQQIKNIRVIGTRSLDQEHVIAVSGIRIGSKLHVPGPEVHLAVKRILEDEMIEDVRLYVRDVSDGVELVIEIVETHQLSNVIISGIKVKEDRLLRENIKFPIDQVLSVSFLAKLKKEIIDYWNKIGYLYVQVDFKVIPDVGQNSGQAKLHVQINKGEKWRVGRVQFSGNDNISSVTLRAQMDHISECPRLTVLRHCLRELVTLRLFKSDGLLWNRPTIEQLCIYGKEHVIIGETIFDNDKLLEDQKSIIRYYRAKGFRNASIVDTITKKDEEGGVLDIHMHVKEGEKYTIGTIQWSGNYLYDDACLNRALGIRTGDIYDQDYLQSRFRGGEGVHKLYADNGYLSFSVTPIELDCKNNIINLEMRVHEGEKARIRRVNIDGNTITHDDVIRREIKTLPGDLFNINAIKDSIMNLKQASLFKPDIGFDVLPCENSKMVDFRYKVSEGMQISPRLSVTTGLNTPIIGTLGMSCNNISLQDLFNRKKWPPLGGGQDLSFSVNFSEKRDIGFSFDFTDKWLGGIKPRYFNIMLALEKSSAIDRENDNKINENGYAREKRLRIMIGSRFTKHSTVRYGINFSHIRCKNYEFFYKGDKSSCVFQDHYINVSVSRNSTDSMFLPTEGMTGDISVNITPPYSWISTDWYKDKQESLSEYYRLTSSASYNYRLFDEFILHIHGEAGCLGTYVPSRGIGPFRRFIIGGSDLFQSSYINNTVIAVRGYDYDLTPKKGNKSYEGGVLYDKFIIELRYPLPFIIPMYINLFGELAQGWSGYDNIDLSTFYSSVGIGVRLMTPFGLLNCGAVYGLNRQGDHADKQASSIYFDIGM